MKSRTITIALVVLTIVVYLLHQDYWNWRAYKPLLLGFLPVGLAYHALYSIAAATLMALLVKFAWPSELERVERYDPAKSPGESQE